MRNIRVLVFKEPLRLNIMAQIHYNNGSSCHLWELNPIREDNNHSSKPLEINPTDVHLSLTLYIYISVCVCFHKKKIKFIQLLEYTCF